MRLFNTARNAVFGMLGQAVTLLFSFLTRTLFIYTLGIEYLGVSGLFSKILTVLSLSELGIGWAMVYALYKPLAEENTGMICSLMALYRKAYYCVGAATLLIGLGMVPFLPWLLNGSTDLANIKVIYFLYLTQTVASYFCCSYKRSIFLADQKQYIEVVFTQVIHLVSLLIQAAVLIIYRSFIAYTVVGVASTILTNLAISIKADRMYPYLKEKHAKPLKADELAPIKKNIIGLSMFKINAVINDATDNIVISAMLGTALVGYYSNYFFILAAINSVIGTLFSSATASIGNVNATESKEKREEIFKALDLASFAIYGFCVVCFFVLSNPFISDVWLGPDFIFSLFTVFIISLDFLTDGLFAAIVKYEDTSGQYWQLRYRFLVTGVINFVLSIALARPLGVAGVLIATIVSRLSTFWYDVIIIYKNIFQKQAWSYFARYGSNVLLICCVGAISYFICGFLPDGGVIAFTIKALVCCAATGGMIFALVCKRPEAAYFRTVFSQLSENYRVRKNSQ